MAAEAAAAHLAKRWNAQGFPIVVHAGPLDAGGLQRLVLRALRGTSRRSVALPASVEPGRLLDALERCPDGEADPDLLHEAWAASPAFVILERVDQGMRWEAIDLAVRAL